MKFTLFGLILEEALEDCSYMVNMLGRIFSMSPKMSMKKTARVLMSPGVSLDTCNGQIEC